MRAIMEWQETGGPIMAVLAVLGIILYCLVIERFIALFGRSTSGPDRCKELQRAMAARDPGSRSGHDLERLAHLLALAERPELTRGLGLIRALVAAAPLLGLLGTVGGMMTTFEGILLGDRTHFIGTGISQALLTTQYGLAIAIPGLVAERILTRRSQRIADEGARVAAECLAKGEES